MRRVWGVLISVALITGTLQAVPAQEPIKIGVVGPHSGPAAYDGLSTLIGAQVAAEEINTAGGLLGSRKIEIVAADSRGIPAESVSAYRKVVTQDKVVAVDCCWFSSSTIATHPTIEELKIPTTPGEKDFYSYLTKVKALNPDGINVVDISATAATQVKQMSELGLTAKPLGSDGPITDAFIRIAGKAAEGVPLVVRYGVTLDTPRNKGFVNAFRAKRNGEDPDQYAQAGYDSIYLHADAIKRAGSTDPAKLRAALGKSEYVSVAGSPIRFDERQQATPKLYVAVVKDGKRVIVEEVDTSGVPY
jgi:ABC-type branched-subunit amino acid transport system substrate-binding protein